MVGTSGWQYADWKERFYPAGVPQRRWLEYYSAHFPTVESNASFYRLPRRETFEGWRERTPDGFVMAVKASRYLTHVRRLQEPEEPVERLMRAASRLGSKLGPILVQLPPTLRADAGLLDRCLGCFPDTVRVVVEPRHPSWWTDEVKDVLEKRAATLCWADRKQQPLSPLWRTADWAYLRFHEGSAQPWPSYEEETLRSWKRRLADTWPQSADIFVYFNNDPGGAAIRDAVTFVQAA